MPQVLRSTIARTVLHLGLGSILLAPAAFAATAQDSQQAEQNDLQARLDRLTERLETLRDEHHIPGFSVAVVKDDSVIYARGFGLADVENNIPCTEHTVFAAGSTTKAFTATLIGMLVDDRLMNWDDPATGHLPWFTPAIDSEDADAVITIRDMLAHRTGFTRMSLLFVNGQIPTRDILDTATTAEPFAPFRSRFLYNNVMYAAAGECAAAATGSTWRDLMHERVLKPLGMASATLSVAEAQQRGDLALGYRWDAQSQAFEHLPMREISNVGPAGSLNASVVDMAKWVRFLLNEGDTEAGRLISPEALHETFSPQMDIAGEMKYGLGWMLRTYDGKRLIEHGGNIDGFAAQVALLPEENLGMVFLSNVSYTPLQTQTITMIFDAVLKEDATVADIAAAAEGDDEADVDEGIDIAAVDLSALEGVFIADYATFHDERFTVGVNGEGRLTLDIPSQTTYILEKPREDGRRPFVGVPSIAASFTLGDDGKASILHLHQGGLSFDIPREGFEFPIEIPLDELRRYCGVYRFNEMNADIDVLIQNNHLAVDVPNQMIFELHPPDEAGLWNFRANDIMKIAVEFTEGEDGIVESMTLHQAGQKFVMPRTRGVDDRPLPRLDELVERCRLEERHRAFSEAGMLRLDGTLRFVHSGIDGSYETVFDDGERAASVIDFGRYGRIRTVVLPGGGVVDASFDRLQKLEGQMLEHSKRNHPLSHLGDWRQFYDSILIHGWDSVDGRDVVVLKVRAGDSPVDRLFIDLETGDVLKTITLTEIPEIEGMTIATTSLLRDWREHEGLRLPFNVEITNDQNGTMRVRIERITIGYTPDPAMFRLTRN